MSEKSLDARAWELVDEVAGEPCDHHALDSRRRYWCSTHQEYGVDEGCKGERARALMKEANDRV